MKNARCESVNTLRNTRAGQSTNAAMLGTRTLLKGVATLPARPVAGVPDRTVTAASASTLRELLLTNQFLLLRR